YLRDGAGNHEAQPVRRPDEAEGERDDADDRERNGMHVDRNRERLQRRADDDDGWNRIEETADHQEHARNEETGPDQAEMPRRDVFEKRPRNLEVGEQPAEDRGRAHAEQRDCRELAGLEKRGPEMMPVHLAVEEDR